MSEERKVIEVPDGVLVLEDATGAMFLRQSLADGTYGDAKVTISQPIGSAAILFEYDPPKGKRVQWLLRPDSKAIFGLMEKESQ